MSPTKKPIIISLSLILLCSCVAFFSGLGLGVGLNKTAEAPTSTILATDEAEESAQSGTPPYEPAERPAPRGQLLWEDDFSEKRWEVSEDKDHHKGYSEGQYFILVEAEEYNFWTTAGKTFADFVLEIDTNQLDGTDENDYGVILRYQDNGNFYYFKISGDGYYTFGKLVDDEMLDIIRWQESDIIRLGSSRNQLQVEAVGEDFSFYINDELVDTAIDATFAQGDIGVVVGTYQNSGVHIAFDDLKVWAIEE
jgi:hypothetical protein